MTSHALIIMMRGCCCCMMQVRSSLNPFVAIILSLFGVDATKDVSYTSEDMVTYLRSEKVGAPHRCNIPRAAHCINTLQLHAYLLLA